MDRHRWGLAASIASHGLCLLAAGVLLLPRASEPMPDAGVEVIFAPPPPSVSTVSSATLVRQPARQIAEHLPANIPPISAAAATRPVTTDKPRSPATSQTASPPRKQNSPTSAAIPVPLQTDPLRTDPLRTDPLRTDPPQTAASHEDARAELPGEIPAGLMAVLQARIRQAVKDATVYPDSARMMRREGRAQIGFAFAGGVVSHVALVVSSGSRILDTAALSAVQSATMPTAPAQIGNRMLALQVWVQFSLASDG